jgi:hypothetical protein
MSYTLKKGKKYSKDDLPLFGIPHILPVSQNPITSIKEN